MDLSLSQLIKIARRWWWLIILAPLIGGGTAYVSADRQTPLYSASVTIQVNPPNTQNSVDLSAINGAQRLAETYRQLIRTYVVLDPLIESLDLPYDVGTLLGKSFDINDFQHAADPHFGVRSESGAGRVPCERDCEPLPRIHCGTASRIEQSVYRSDQQADC